MLHLAKRRESTTVCKDCGQLKYGLPDNIDPFAEEILRRF
jgi:hypothetical protein